MVADDERCADIVEAYVKVRRLFPLYHVFFTVFILLGIVFHP